MSDKSSTLDGLVSVKGYLKNGRPPEEVMIMEKAENYGVNAVLFEASREGKPPIAQAFVFVSNEPADSPEFAETHRQLWSWGGVPLVYRVTPGLVQLFRCAHKADFLSKGKKICKPHKILKIAANIANDRLWDIEQILNGSFSTDPWWDAERLCNGTLWDDPQTCKELLSSKVAAQKTLINEIQRLHHKLNPKRTTNDKEPLRRKLLILSLLIAYLDARKVFEPDYFSKFKSGATQFFEVLTDGPALVNLLDDLERQFNGHVFTLSYEDQQTLGNSNYSTQLTEFARMVEGKQEANGQLTLWERYSFADLPVEIISHIYQLFVKDSSAVYTPPFLVRFMLGEVLSWERLDRLERENEVILDPSCGSGVFLVEAYKRLVLHWRSRNQWQKPTQDVLKMLLTKVHGIDLEEDAIELAAFSLCLALCDALKPEEIWSSDKLFPELKEKSIHSGCFFAACEQGRIQEKIGVIVGNPPFKSSVSCSDAAKRAYDRYNNTHVTLPDKQLAYLFLHESMEMLEQGGVLALLQQYNFLYNKESLEFRQKFIERWDVREILDFISVRGLFHKEGGGDTKVLVVVAEAVDPPKDRQILHATFRRSGRTDAEQGFDMDYYDMHWLPRELVLTNDGVWRSDLVGGGRVLGFVDRLKKFKTLGQYAQDQGWDYGEGFIEGKSGNRQLAKHITGHPVLPSKALTSTGIDAGEIRLEKATHFKTSYTKERFTAPLLLIRAHMDLPHDILTKGYLTYTQMIIGFSSSICDTNKIEFLDKWIKDYKKALIAFVAASSHRVFTQKATALSKDDIDSLPFNENDGLQLSSHELILIDDIADYYRNLIRLGEDSAAMIQPGINALPDFNETYTKQINAIYKVNSLHALTSYHWQGVICQPYVFGEGEVDWEGADELKDKLDSLLREQRGSGLNVTRIARIYDGDCIYLLKPDRLRYWLRSIALRDADETLADLWDQGF